MSSRKHFHRSDAYQCGEGNRCSWFAAAAPIIAAAVGGGLGLLSAREQNRRQEEATERSQGVARQMAQPRVWGPAEPYATGLLRDAANLYRQNMFSPQTNALELLGRQGMLRYAEGALPQLIGATHRSFAQGLDPGLNPYVPAMIDAAQRDLQQDYERGVLPRIRSGSQAVGGFGGSRQGVAEGIASQGLLDAMGDVSTRLLSDAYGQALQQQRAAWELAPNMAMLGFMPSQTQMDVGAMYRGDPRRAAENLMGYAGAIGPYTQIQSGGGTVIPYQAGASPWTGAAQGAMTGLGLYNMWNQFQNRNNRWIGGGAQLGAAGPGTSGTGFLNQGYTGTGGSFL